jgi:CRISPR/Cas system-associated protein Cas5 (RAMP superfamily)
VDIDQLFDEFIEFPEGSNGKYVTTVSTKLFAKYCTEKLQEENERLLFSNRYNADMYRQIDDERKRLQAEVERLRKDKKRIDAIEANCWDVRYLGDAGEDVAIEIIGHFMAKPWERVVGENYREDLRAAIDQAMKADAYPPARPEYEDSKEQNHAS